MIAWLTCLTLLAPPELPPEPEPSEPAIEVTAPAPEAGPPPEVVPTPEQVRADAAQTPPSAGGDPFAKPPSPQARPSEGVYAVGSGPVTPLPAPPPPVPVSAIPKFDWRGIGWLSLRLTVTGPIGGSYPARTSVVSLGGAVEGGWRINQIVGLGLGLSRQPHEVIRQTGFDDSSIVRRGTLTSWDIAFVRLFAPVRGRVDPFLDLGGGMAFLDPAREGEPFEYGGMARGSVGFDAWVAKNLTIGASGLYRATFLRDSIGHAVQGAVELALHW
jgi:hypothetical protein